MLLLRFLKLSPRSLDRFLIKYGWGPNLKGDFGQRWIHIEGRHCEEVEEDTATASQGQRSGTDFSFTGFRRNPLSPHPDFILGASGTVRQ